MRKITSYSVRGGLNESIATDIDYDIQTALELLNTDENFRKLGYYSVIVIGDSYDNLSFKNKREALKCLKSMLKEYSNTDINKTYSYRYY